MGDIIGGLGDLGSSAASGIGSYLSNNPGTSMRLAGQGLNMLHPQGSGLANMLTMGGDIANIGQASVGTPEYSVGSQAAQVPAGGAGMTVSSPGAGESAFGNVPSLSRPSSLVEKPMPTIKGSLDTGMSDMKAIQQDQATRAAALQRMFGNQGPALAPLSVVQGRSGGSTNQLGSPNMLPNSAQLIAQILAAKSPGLGG